MEPPVGISFDSKFYEMNQALDYQPYKVNGTKFAIFLNEISSDGSMNYDLANYNVVLFAPLQAEHNITIVGKTIVCFSRIHAINGKTEIHASGTLAMLGANIESLNDNVLRGTKDVILNPAIPSRVIAIKKMFDAGLACQNSEGMIDGISETYDAVVDPLAEDESDTINMDNVIKFFDIPRDRLS